MQGTDAQLTLRDGRALGYATYGDPRGKPVFFFHGLPGSRLDGKLIEDVAARANVRLIGTDRPGFGLSDFQPGRRICDWPGDVTQLADALGLDRFSVLGVSGGGPYAAVCAHRIPHRLKSVGIVAGVAPLHQFRHAVRSMSRLARLGLFLARRAPYLLTPVYRVLTGLLWPNPDRFHLVAVSVAPDRPILEGPVTQALLRRSFHEAFRNGIDGGVWDLGLHGRGWGFELDEIPIEVQLWHGELDRTVPPIMGRYLAQAIPRCRARFYPEDGHFSLPIRHADEILRALIA